MVARMGQAILMFRAYGLASARVTVMTANSRTMLPTQAHPRILRLKFAESAVLEYLKISGEHFSEHGRRRSTAIAAPAGVRSRKRIGPVIAASRQWRACRR